MKGAAASPNPAAIPLPISGGCKSCSEEEDEYAEVSPDSGNGGSELSNIKRIINEYKVLYKSKVEEQKQKVFSGNN